MSAALEVNHSNAFEGVVCLDLPSGFGFDVSIQTGEIVDQIESAFDRQKRNFLRRSAAQEILQGYRPVKQLLACGSSLGKVQVWKAVESRTAHFSNVQSCGHVWLCGTCSPKVSVRRGQKLALALISSASLGIGVALVTLTVRHNSSQSFADVLERLRILFEGVTQGSFSRRFRNTFQLCGSVRVVEITYGLAGWHPHVHQLIFYRGFQDLAAIRESLFSQWSRTSKRLWNDALSAEAIDVRDGRSAALYVSKMGLETELVGAPWKDGTGSSSTHFQLLDARSDDSDSLFREFAQSISRPGKKRARTFRQIVWSRGLTATLGLADEQSDEELAASIVEPARMVGELSSKQWRILNEAGRDAIPNVLRLAATSGWSSVEKFIDILSGSLCPPRGDAEPSTTSAATRTTNV